MGLTARPSTSDSSNSDDSDQTNESLNKTGNSRNVKNNDAVIDMTKMRPFDEEDAASIRESFVERGSYDKFVPIIAHNDESDQFVPRHGSKKSKRKALSTRVKSEDDDISSIQTEESISIEE